MSCLLGDAGIAIGLTSLPFRQEMQFYKNEIADSLFPKYKEAVFKNFAPELSDSFKSEFNDYFYKPVPYYLFGSFDLAVVALVDDFEMTARTFRPFDPMLSNKYQKSYRENFFYKVITGPTPQFKPEDSVVRLASRTFLSDDRMPLFAMSLQKLNNALLLGAGADFLRLVVRFIKATARRVENRKLQVILLESYSAHEVTLLIFTDSYSSAAGLITAVREARVRDLAAVEPELLPPAELKSLLSKSLLADIPRPHEGSSDIFDAPLFTDTESYFGFDFRMLDPLQRHLLDRVDPSDFLDLYCQWSVRPGYLQASMSEIVRASNGNVSSCIGRGDIMEQEGNVPTRNVIEKVLRSLNQQSPPRHARRRQTVPALEVLPASLVNNETVDDYPDLDLSRMRFTVPEITRIQDQLRAAWTPKILTGKVLNAFTNFNDGILDPALYGYFVELLPLMELLEQKVTSWDPKTEQPDLGLICKTLEKITDNFERAYRNRFYNSYRMGDITDFNLDFKGGIQQLLTSFDAAYKAICSVLGMEESFVYVAGSPGVYSTRYEVRLNYYHIFQPEIFGCIANHEAANFYLSRSDSPPLPQFATGANLISDPQGFDGSVIRRLHELKETASGDNEDLLPFVTRQLLNWVFIDLLALYFGYNRNVSLFEHWYWGYFSQNSFAYSRSGDVDEIQFIGFLLRMLWIERLSGAKKTAEFTFGLDSFDKLRHAWEPMLNRFLDWLWTDEEFRNWNAQVRTYVHAKFLQVHAQRNGETIEAISGRIETHAGELQKQLARGEVCAYTRKDGLSKFRFTEQLFYAYLSLLTDRFGEGEILLPRASKGVAYKRPSSAKALFDPIGGIFTHDPATRRERFKYRAALTMSLWDMAQKEKKQVVIRRLSREIPSDSVDAA